MSKRKGLTIKHIFVTGAILGWILKNYVEYRSSTNNVHAGTTPERNSGAVLTPPKLWEQKAPMGSGSCNWKDIEISAETTVPVCFSKEQKDQADELGDTCQKRIGLIERHELNHGNIAHLGSTTATCALYSLLKTTESKVIVMTPEPFYLTSTLLKLSLADENKHLLGRLFLYEVKNLEMLAFQYESILSQHNPISMLQMERTPAGLECAYAEMLKDEQPPHGMFVEQIVQSNCSASELTGIIHEKGYFVYDLVAKTSSSTDKELLALRQEDVASKLA